MTNKIVILDNSVELYEHYISDEKWERTFAFPRGGLTYLISNRTIKFYAFEDYLYRNCLISMQLPVYVVDEKRHIDGEYDVTDEIIEVLDPIFPSNDVEAELAYYLTIAEAQQTYQPKGDYLTKTSADTLYQPIGEYVTDEELVEALDDYYTKSEADARFQPIGDYVSGSTFSAYTATTDAEIAKKLDASAFTPYDLSNYYTKYEVYNKQEIDNKIQSGGTFDPTLYYTKDESNSRFALKTEIPSLNGYATQDWVINKNYLTESTFNTYITNLQEQINSLINTISGCCSSSGETIYRWLTMTGENDYICSGTTKYEKQVYQESSDNGITWRNVEPTQYRKGNVIEYDSSDCGYVPEIQYRWYTAPSNEYICSGTSKYYKQYYQQSSDNGMTWVNVVPEQTRMGNLMEKNSLDCGYVTPQYRWKSADPITDYICSGTTKYYKEYYQVSNDSGQTWANVTPTQTRMGGIVNIHSTDCGEPHVADMLMTYKVTSGQSAHLLQGNVSVGFMKAELTRGTYTEVTVPPPSGNNPIYATFDYTSNDANGMIEWTSDGIHATSFSGTALHTATIYEGIVYMQGDVFVCPYLEYLELPSTFARASWTFAHDCPELKTVVVNAITPPSILGVPFENCPKLSAIFVPDESVEEYKTHSDTRYWDVYANIIKPLSEKP